MKSYYIGEIHSDVNVQSLGLQLKILAEKLLQTDIGTQLIVFKGKGSRYFLEVSDLTPQISVQQTITSCTFTHEAPFIEIFRDQFKDLLWYEFNINTGVINLTPVSEEQRTFS